MTTVSSLSETIKSNFLSLSGGTMTGAIKKGGGYFIENIGKDGALFIANDDTHSYTNFGVYGTNHESYPNVFLVKCSDGTSTKYLMGYPDGKLLWGGKNVVCVESWNDGTSWYRKYSDGFIEQGGNFSLGNDSYTTSVTFPKAFANTNYCLTFGINSSSSSATQFRHHGSISRTQTSFVCWANNAYITKSWHSCGF